MQARGAPTNPLSPPLEIGFDPSGAVPRVSSAIETVRELETREPSVWRAEHSGGHKVVRHAFRIGHGV